ncbi:MAG: hypothetical protein V4692_05870 [Bdellovibrionota bacterium]
MKAIIVATVLLVAITAAVPALANDGLADWAAACSGGSDTPEFCFGSVPVPVAEVAPKNKYAERISPMGIEKRIPLVLWNVLRTAGSCSWGSLVTEATLAIADLSDSEKTQEHWQNLKDAYNPVYRSVGACQEASRRLRILLETPLPKK